jgi:NAD kinase
MSSLNPRVVVVTRRTEYEALLAAHATRGQTEFFLASRGQNIGEIESRHHRQLAAVAEVRRAVPDDWSLAAVSRDDLDRYLFGPEDIVIAVGQDGLVANLAKYLSGQPVVGVTPETGAYEGILTTLRPRDLPALLPDVAAGRAPCQRRTMVETRLDDGRHLLAVNELFLGHRSHQSARYRIDDGESQEFQSSSGIIVATGTGLTGWARSILLATQRSLDFSAEDREAAFFAREPWPGRHSGTTMSHGRFGDGGGIFVTSRMNSGGVIFADGVEQDFLRFDWGVTATVSLSQQTLNLIAAA